MPGIPKKSQAGDSVIAKLSEVQGFIKVHWHRLLAATAVGVVFGALMYVGPEHNDGLSLPRYVYGVTGFVVGLIFGIPLSFTYWYLKSDGYRINRERGKLVREAVPMTDDLKLAISIIRRPFVGTLIFFSFPISLVFLIWIFIELDRDTGRMGSMWKTMYPRKG